MILEQTALKLGAAAAAFIPLQDISIEEQLAEYCRPSSCKGYGSSINCPPNVLKPQQAEQWIKKFRGGILYKLDVPPASILSEERFDYFKRIFIIGATLEKQAILSLGYEAYNLAAGCCKPVFCKNSSCAALNDGSPCVYPYLARPSMEALGINVFKLMKTAGWKIYPIFSNSRTEEIPSAVVAGMTLINSYGE